MEKINNCEEQSKLIKWNITQKILNKAANLNIKIPKGLKQEIYNSEALNKADSGFKCQICQKVFKEGRQLGGHISRAHKKHEKM